jgi:Na+-transporting NADH:ubiquinone oxidoreductase subunit NqrB
MIMISIHALPHTFGFGLSFNVGLPVENSIGQHGKLWGFTLLVGFFTLQVNYVDPEFYKLARPLMRGVKLQVRNPMMRRHQEPHGTGYVARLPSFVGEI